MSAAQDSALPTVAILGSGSMGGAILSGLLADGRATVPIRVTTRSAESAERLRGPRVDAASTADDPEANRRAAARSDVVVLGVKPVGIVALASEIAEALAPGAVVVSVAAGIPTSAVEAVLRPGTAVVRAMPNTPSTVGRGVTGISAGSSASEDDLDRVRRVFETVGSVHRVPESQIDALTSVSGSGPAYVFYLIEKLAEAGVARGLDPELAAALAAETFAGASALLAASDAGPAELRRRVTSPGGTTARALAVFDEHDLGGILDGATAAAAARAAEMAADAG